MIEERLHERGTGRMSNLRRNGGFDPGLRPAADLGQGECDYDLREGSTLDVWADPEYLIILAFDLSEGTFEVQEM